MEYSAIRAFIRYLFGAEGDYTDYWGAVRTAWESRVVYVEVPSGLRLASFNATVISSNAANGIGDETADTSDER
ncbi:MAG: hypothetical protein MUF37_02040 [Methanoregulaceae archaeon]|jgi:hypothetical protein|nr:hypothetical protein [Methanoregulaceae archaeon]